MVEGGPGAGAGGPHALPRFSTRQPGPMRMGLKWVGAGGLVELSVVGSPPVAVGESDLHLSDACATGPACFGDAANVHGICAHACRRIALAWCVQWQEHALVVAADTHRRSNLTLQPRDGGLSSRKSKDSCASRLSPCTAKHSSGMGVETLARARARCLPAPCRPARRQRATYRICTSAPARWRGHRRRACLRALQAMCRRRPACSRLLCLGVQWR